MNRLQDNSPKISIGVARKLLDTARSNLDMENNRISRFHECFFLLFPLI